MDLQQYRAEIDEIDRELTRLFVRRMELSAQIAAYKRENGLPVLDGRREREKLADVEASLPDELREYGAALFRTLFALSRDRQEQLLADADAQVDI